MQTRIMLADDHKMVREGLRGLIEKQKTMEVIGETEDGHQAVRMAHKLSPDIVVMDISMPTLNGIEATRQIMKVKSTARIIGLSQHADRRYVTEMMKAGASGYLLKDAAFEELLDAIRAVMRGRTYLSSAIAETVVGEIKRIADENNSTVFTVLTDREREVLQQISEGHTTKEIARALFVSVKTIETHRAKIMEKTGRHSVAELTKYAVREGLTNLEE